MVFDICDHDFSWEATRMDVTAEWAEVLQHLEIQDMNTDIGTNEHTTIVNIEQLLMNNFQSWVTADLQLREITSLAGSVHELMEDRIQYWNDNLQHDTAILHDTKDSEQYGKVLKNMQWDLGMKNDYEALASEINKLAGTPCGAKNVIESLKDEGNSNAHNPQYATYYNISTVTAGIKSYEKSVLAMMDKLDNLHQKAMGILG